VSSAAITLCVAFERLFIVVSLYFVIDSVRELLDTATYMLKLILAIQDGHYNVVLYFIQRVENRIHVIFTK
jgi:hypothetical protein